jgi:hypothetical protein
MDVSIDVLLCNNLYLGKYSEICGKEIENTGIRVRR